MVQTLNFINLSSQQAPNDVDWAGLVNSGVQGVLIRLGHGIIRDPCASGHIAKAKQYGLYWHGYHTYEGVVNEPQFTIKNATELGLSTSQYYFVDLTKSSDPFNDYYALHATWLSQGYSTGLLISNEDYLSKFKDSEVIASGTLRWLISDTEPADYDVWQYSSEGTVGTSSVKVGFNFAKTDKLKYNLSTTLTGTDINKDPYNPQTPVGGAYIGWGYDTTGLGGGKTFGYSTNGKNFYALVGPKGLVVRKSDGNRIYGTIADQIDSAISANVIPAKSAADSAVAYANDAIEKSRVNSQAIDDINSAVSDAASDAAVARSDGLRAWNAAQSNVNLIDLNYASASASISSARTEAIAAADEAKASASAAKADIVAVRSDVAAVQADVTATRSDVAVAKSDIADTKTTLEQTASGLNSKISGVAISLADTTSALSDAKTALASDVADAKKLANTAQATADSAVKSAGENAKALTSQANALSETKKAIDSDVASAKGLANVAQTTADSAVKSASSVANDLAKVASQVNANSDGITKVTSDVGLLQTTVADNSGNISKIQETASQIQQAVSDNAGNITTAKQTADSAVAVASDAKSNATIAVQTASGASVTAKNAQGDATTAMTTAKGAVTQASDAKSNATIAVQTASEASLTATNAQGDASIAKQTASDASVQIKNAQGDISKLQTRAGAIETSVANNSGAIADVQATANQLKASVSDNAGNITVAKQTADSAVAVASDAKSNATVAIQTASQASITAKNASGQAASAVITANGAMTTASDAKSNATVAVQTASGASLTATNANSDATVAKQTASEAKVQASNAESDFAQISIRAGQIEASVANNSGAIASVQQTANGLTTTVADIKANGGGRNLWLNSKSFAHINVNIPEVDWNTDSDGIVTAHITGNGGFYGKWRWIYANSTDPFAIGDSETFSVEMKGSGTITIGRENDFQKAVTLTGNWTRYAVSGTVNSTNRAHIIYNESGVGCDAYVRLPMVEKGTVAHDWSPASEDLQNQFTQTKESIDGIATTINDPKTGLNATYQTATGNATTISNVKGDVSQLKVSASSASVALSDAAGNISSLKATASELETKYADAAGDINKLKIDAKGTAQTLTDAQGDIAKLKTRADGFDAEFATANGNISKLQTDATGTTQTLANTKSDVAVLQSRADGLDAKYANAAGDINTLKANASGFSQTLTDAKGDISTLQSTVTGFKNTLTDAQGNISTLQSDVSGLKKTTSDHNGNIATLQADAKTLTSQMADAQGNISTLKQTASGFSSKVSGMETSLANANSKINDIQANGGGVNLARDTDKSLETTTDDAAFIGGLTPEEWKQYEGKTLTFSVTIEWKNWKTYWNNRIGWELAFNVGEQTIWDLDKSPHLWINNQPDGSSGKKRLSTTITVPENIDDDVITGQTAYIQTHGDYFKISNLMVEEGTVAHTWSPAPEDTDAKITTNSTAIEQNRKAITLKADQTAVDKTNGTVQQLQSQLKVQADQIATKVSSSDLDAKGYATQTYTQAQIKQTSDSWNANLTSVSNGLTKSYTNLHATVDGIQAQVYNKDGSSKITQLSNLIATKVSQGDYKSQITQLKDDINLQVKKGDVISQINQEAGGNTLIQVSDGMGSLILDAKTTVFTGEAFIPSAAISSIQADKIQIGNSQLFSDDGTLNLINKNSGTASIKLTTGNVQGSTQPVTKFANGYNTSAIDISPVGTVIRPTLFFEDYPGQAKDTGWLGFSRHDTAELYFHTYDDTKELFRVACVSRFNQELHVDRPIWQQGLSIASGNTIWSGSDYLAIGDHLCNSYTNVMARAFSSQSTLSSKTNIETVDPKDALDLVNRTDIRSYQYKADVAQGKTKRYTSLIIDDVHDVSRYYAPNEFTNEERTGRDDGSAVGYLFLAVKELTRRIKTLEEKLNG